VQNSAQWLATTKDGFTVRVGFSPMSEAEAQRTATLLKNCKAVVVATVTNGRMSVDLVFTDAAVPAPLVFGDAPVGPTSTGAA
jgi:hypothetical protein